MATPNQDLENCLEKYRSTLVATARAIVAPHLRTYLEPSDLVQNTMLEAHQHAPQLAGLEERSVLAWLRRALKHNILDAIKHLKTQKQDYRRTLRTSELDPSPDSPRQQFLAADTSPSQTAQRTEQIHIMFAAIEELPANQRIAIILKHLEGRSLREISEVLGFSEPAIAGLLHRGRQQLMRRMGEAGTEV